MAIIESSGSVESLMSEAPKLPKKEDKGKILLPAAGLMFWLFALSAFVITILVNSIIAGDLVFTIAYAALSLLLFWSLGALFISVPLNVYFHLKYRNDTNYALNDRVHRRALKLLKKLPVRRHMSVGATMSNLGILRLCQGQYESAAELFSEARDYLEKRPSGVKYATTIVILNNLAISYMRLQKYVEAEFIAAEALEAAETQAAQKEFKMLAAAPLAIFGAIRMRLGRYEEAEDYYKKAMDLYCNAPVPKYYTKDSFAQAIAFGYLGLAYCALKLGSAPRSLEYYELALPIIKDKPHHMNTLSIEPLFMLANEYMNSKLFKQAEELLEFAYKIAHEHPFHPDSKQLLNYYEKLLLLTDRQSEIADMRSWLRPLDCRLLSGA